MEKRLERVQRWVDRCIEACRCKAWSSAIAELECARAELDSAGREIWEEASEAAVSRKPRRFRDFVGVPLQSVIVALLILFVAVGPTSMESFSASRSLSLSQPKPMVEWVTADEKVLLESLRKSLSQSHVQNETVGIAAGTGSGKASVKNRNQAIKGFVEKPVAGLPETSIQRGLSLPAEDLLSLIQVGQRALRSEGEILRVERP